MTVTVTCPACPAERDTVIPDEAQGPGEKLFAATIAHEVEWHLGEMMGA